jgi:hypothetical protein
VQGVGGTGWDLDINADGFGDGINLFPNRAIRVGELSKAFGGIAVAGDTWAVSLDTDEGGRATSERRHLMAVGAHQRSDLAMPRGRLVDRRPIRQPQRLRLRLATCRSPALIGHCLGRTAGGPAPAFRAKRFVMSTARRSAWHREHAADDRHLWSSAKPAMPVSAPSSSSSCNARAGTGRRPLQPAVEANDPAKRSPKLVGELAVAVASYCRRVVAVEVSAAMLGLAHRKAEAARTANVEFVHAGFLTYTHQGEPADMLYSRNALHQLPDFWKAMALGRIAATLRPHGILRLRDLVYSFDPAEAAGRLKCLAGRRAKRPREGVDRPQTRQPHPGRIKHLLLAAEADARTRRIRHHPPGPTRRHRPTPPTSACAAPANRPGVP